MNPTPKQLEAFVWTAKLGSFQAAATRLHATQSAISKRVAELEEIFDTRLFDRKYRRAKLTHNGERLVLSAEEVLAANQKMMATIADPTTFHGVFRLGASELVGLTWLPKLVQRIRVDHPAVVIDLEIEAGGQVLEKLKNGLIDLALVPGPFWGRQFGSVRLESVEFSWMGSPKLKAPRRAMTPEEMSSYPMLVHSPQGVATQLYDLWLRQSGFSIQRTLTANTLSVMAQLTIGGLGVSCLPTQYFREQVRAGSLVKLKTSPPLPKLDFFAVYRRDAVYPLAERVIQIAQAVCDFRNPSAAEQ
jgi:DNA-binding transcriptional LysR family regulator